MAAKIPSVKALHTDLRLSFHDAVTLHDALKKALVEGNSAIEDVLREASRYMGMHGVASIQDERAPTRRYWLQSRLHYVNTGDTYDRTLGYDVDENAFRILYGGWGDWLERYEREVGYEVA